MPSSPFKRRPALSKTYGKRSSSATASASPAPARPTATKPDKSALAALLADSSDEDSDKAVEAQLVGRRVDEGGTQGKGKARAVQRREEDAMDEAETAQRGGKPERGVSAIGATVVSSLAGKRRSSNQGAGAAGADEATAVDSTVWDESTASSGRPPAPPPVTRKRSSRRQSTAAAAEPSHLKESQTASPPKRTRRSHSPTKAAPPTAEAEPLSDSPPPRRKRARRSVEPSTSAQSERAGPSHDKTDDGDVPPPFDYVPLKSRLRSSPSKASSPAPSPPKPHPPSRRPTSSTMSRELSSNSRFATLPTIQTAHPSSCSPARPRTPNRIGSAALPAPPISPAKDLAALFSRFSGSRAEKDKNVAEDKLSSKFGVGLKRTTSAGEGGVVAALGPRKGAGEKTEEDRNSRAGAPASLPRPTRIALDRSISQPHIPISPHSPRPSSPAAGSPFRHGLVEMTSLPSISPLPLRTTGSRSPSPHKPAQSRPALGSAYRPFSFGLSANVAEPRTRTYGGARSFRRDIAEEALLADPAAVSSSRALSNLNLFSSPRLPSLPPSVSHRIPAPSIPRETYSQLREKWGVAAEEELDEDEANQSTERGAKVVGTGILRAQGEGKRWGDEMGWVLEGLREGKGGSGARSSAIELLGKTLDREWMRRLKSSGMAEQVYLTFRRGGAGEGDRVLDVALVLLVALLFSDQRLSEPLFRLSPSDFASSAASSQSDTPATSSSPRKAEYEETERECDLLKVFEGLLRRDWAGEEIGTNKGEGEGKKGGAGKGKMAKSDARHLQSLRDIIDQSELFTNSALPITLRTLLLQTFRTVSLFSPRPIFQPQQLLCTSGAFQATVDVFVDECKMLEQRLQKYQSGMDLVPPPGTSSYVSLPTLNLCLAIFESTSLATPYAFHVISSPAYLSPLGRSLANLVLVTSILALDTIAPTADKEYATALLLSALGIVFGLTTESTWSECLLRPAEVPRDDDGFVGTLIRIVLACRRATVANARKQRSKSGNRERIKPVGDEELNEDDEDKDGEAVEEADNQEWDVLCLALGVLANLVESVEDVKDVLRDLHLSPTCHPGRRCIRHCLCPSPPARSALTTLAQLYLDPLSDAPNSVYQTSVAGFVRLVLGLTLVDNPHNERLVLDALATSSFSRDAEVASPMTAILDALDEFARLHDEQHEVQHGLRLQLEGPPAAHGQGAAGASSPRTQDDPLDLDGTDAEALVAVQRPGAGAGAARRDTEVAERIRDTVERLRARLRTQQGL
ncbi:hypothetical protein JCM21900_002150 [Sporobolomyces salmonicolor]